MQPVTEFNRFITLTSETRDLRNLVTSLSTLSINYYTEDKKKVNHPPLSRFTAVASCYYYYYLSR